MKINISNIETFVYEKVKITVSDLAPESNLKVSLKMELPWCHGEEFSSYAVFTADKNGKIDLDEVKPKEGTYENNDSMGLIYSLRKSKTSGKNIAENISCNEPIIMNMVFESSTETNTVKPKRLFKTKDVITKHISAEFEGTLFYKEKCSKTILMLGGSSGDVNAMELIAAPIASRGFNVLVAPYFSSKNLPSNLEKVPLEYFEKIFKWIEEDEITNTKEIFLYGVSKGGELALLLASRYHQVKKVVAVEPHSYCFQALNGMMSGKNVSSWSYNGKSIPYIEVDNNIFFEEQKKDTKKGIPFGFLGTYRESINRADNREEARIKIENSKADILLIAGKEDNIWNSYDGCLEIMKTLKNNNYKYHAELLCYNKMGHPMPVPYVIPISETLSLPMNGGIFSAGGSICGNAEGQYKSFKKTITFMEDNC